MSRPGREPSLPDITQYLDQILREDLLSFIRKAFGELNPDTPFSHNWHLEVIANQLTRVLLGRTKRLIIVMPPRSLKSLSASVAFPAFAHGHNPALNIIAVSYAQELSANLHGQYRRLILAPWYRRIFPLTRIDRKDTENETLLTARGSRLATSTGGTLTGRGGDILIIDDPLKASDAMSATRRLALQEWYRDTLVSRLNDKKNGAIVIVTQRLHADDLVGFVLDQGADQWTVLKLPAIAYEDQVIDLGQGRTRLWRQGEALQSSREPLHVLEKLRAELGSDAFSAQYLQDPAPPGGNMFKRDWIVRYERAPAKTKGDTILQSWDTASKAGPANDWSVCTTWLSREGLHYLIDVFRDKLDYPALRAKAIELGRRYRPDMILVEDAGIGTALASELRKAFFNTKAIVPIADKQSRASIQTARFEGGRVLFPTKAAWLEEFEAELLAFPGGRHDDQVDSVTQALAYEAPARARTITTAIMYSGLVSKTSV